MNFMKKISISGIIVCGLSIVVLFFGLYDYQQQELKINNEYEMKLSLVNMSLQSEKLLIRVEQLRSSLKNEPTEKEIIKREIDTRLRGLNLKKISNIQKIKQQRKEELDGRIFNFLTYVSLAITIFIFGISLFWRKNDFIETRVQQKDIINKIIQNNSELEQIKEKLQAHEQLHKKHMKYSQIFGEKIDLYLKKAKIEDNYSHKRRIREIDLLFDVLKRIKYLCKTNKNQ
ncbi:hypothetical protein ACJROX_12815 [Pseudalkalibacillus sp. A8]|uniref:hypothetical protein n=1 Tax=Pseudalkalibacillus sp. A8 TaxID=3382641 RepID=UPI0038B455F9